MFHIETLVICPPYGYFGIHAYVWGLYCDVYRVQGLGILSSVMENQLERNMKMKGNWGDIVAGLTVSANFGGNVLGLLILGLQHLGSLLCSAIGKVPYQECSCIKLRPILKVLWIGKVGLRVPESSGSQRLVTTKP